jgi:hypothetical protein
VPLCSTPMTDRPVIGGSCPSGVGEESADVSVRPGRPTIRTCGRR